MNHWIIAPLVLPALLAPLIVLGMRHDLVLQRVFSVVGTLALAAIAVGLFVLSLDGQVRVYEMGNWQAPFGIVMVLDRLSALMVLMTGLLAVWVVLYAIGSGWDARGRHFHALFQFQLMGILGAFLTGDAFNLFVFFEVLLIASYGLMIHGGGAVRLRAGVQYVVMNLAGSTLFLFALGTLYGLTGTLNMADMAARLADLPPGDDALLRVGALLLLVVFAVKAALVPIHFWLPGTYANAPGPVAALFAVMTKVGAYAILRVYTLVFGEGAGQIAGIATDWLMPAALVTLVVGTLGILGARSLMRLIAYAVVGSVGTMTIAIAAFTPGAGVAALYYMLHSTFAAAALFLVADLVLARRGAAADSLAPAPGVRQPGILAALFFAAAIAMTGMPPLAGFPGKLMVLDATRAHPDMVWIWALVLGTSLLAIIGFARAGSAVFWKPAPDADDAPQGDAPPPPPVLALAAIMGLLALIVVLTVAAGPITGWMQATADQIFDPAAYIDAVMGTPEPEDQP